MKTEEEINREIKRLQQPLSELNMEDYHRLTSRIDALVWVLSDRES